MSKSIEQSKPPIPVKPKPSDYQPSKAETEEEIDMPGADLETVRRAFFRRPPPGQRPADD